MIKRLIQNWYWWVARLSREICSEDHVIMMRCAYCGRGVIEGMTFCCEQLEKFCREKMEVRDGFPLD